MTNLDKKKRNIASRMMDIKGSKKHHIPGFGQLGHDLAKLSHNLSAKHVEVTHNKKHSLAF